MVHLKEIVKVKTGLSDVQASAAVGAVMTDLKHKFPKFLHAELDKVASGGDFGDSAREKFDHLRDNLEDAAKKAGEKAEGFAEELKVKFSEMFGEGKKS